MNKIRQILCKPIIPKPKPAVYVSGGLDSTILLHHLYAKTEEKIYTYTFGFPYDHEFTEASQVAKCYGTVHSNILINDFLDRFPEILKHFEKPRFNLWVYWLAEAAKKDGRETCYAAEGLDEHFSGYWYKPGLQYTETWADHWVFVKPTYEIIHKVFDLGLEIPFSSLPIDQTMPHWDTKREKTYLREAYRGILPDFVIDRKKRRGGPDYGKLWIRELLKLFPDKHPQNNYEIQKLLNLYAIKTWLKVHGG